MNHITTSTGERITRSAFDARIRRAKAVKLRNFEDDHGHLFCEQCGKNEKACGKLDCAHIVSVDKCIKNGTPELAYDIRNLKLLCRQHHESHDKTSIQWL